MNAQSSQVSDVNGPKAVPEIELRLKNLGKACGTLAISIEALNSRLNPVMRSGSPIESVDTVDIDTRHIGKRPEHEPGRTPIGTELISLGKTILLHAKTIDDICARLEL